MLKISKNSKNSFQRCGLIVNYHKIFHKCQCNFTKIISNNVTQQTIAPLILKRWNSNEHTKLNKDNETLSDNNHAQILQETRNCLYPYFFFFVSWVVFYADSQFSWVLFCFWFFVFCFFCLVTAHYQMYGKQSHIPLIKDDLLILAAQKPILPGFETTVKVYSNHLKKQIISLVNQHKLSYCGIFLYQPQTASNTKNSTINDKTPQNEAGIVCLCSHSHVLLLLLFFFSTLCFFCCQLFFPIVQKYNCDFAWFCV